MSVSLPCRLVTFAGLAVLVASALALGCRKPSASVPVEESGPLFLEDVTGRVGLTFHHDPGAIGEYRMPQIMGSGGAFLDFDNDGRLDIYLVHNGGPAGKRNQLFRQNLDGVFADVSNGSGIDIAGHGMGVAVADFDNDGFVDVYVSQYGGGRLFRNRGKADGRWLGFEEVTKSAGVEQPRWGTSCAFADYDRNGWLDLVVVNYVDYDPSRFCGDAAGKADYCHPSVFRGTATRLFRNLGRGPDGRWRGYEDATVKSGFARAPGPGLGVACDDFDGDGWPDILVANDARPNHLWINQKDGTFKDEAVRRGIATGVLGQPQANMGVALGDVDDDGLVDVFVTHLTEEAHTLWRQSPRGFFLDGTARAGLAQPRWRGTGFGTIFADLDHDGRLDLAIVNGRVARGKPQQTSELGEFWHAYAERNQLFLNEGEGRFRDLSPANAPFCGTPAVSRGLIWGDYDNDGALDLLVTAVAGPARLYRNVAAKRGRALLVRAVDPALKRDAYGARMTVRAGGRRFLGVVCPGQSYLSSGDARVHLGLGAVERIDELRIDWPDGLAETFPPPAFDALATVERGKGKKVQP